MGRVGILVVSYGARAASMIDAFSQSEKYDTQFFVADKQKNPFNVKMAKEHVVVPGLDINGICDFAKKHKEKIDFGIVGPEGPIVNGVRDLVEKETGIKMICPTKEFCYGCKYVGIECPSGITGCAILNMANDFFIQDQCAVLKID